MDNQPDAECEGKTFDMTFNMSLADFLTNTPEELRRIFERKIGTDEMGGLDLGFVEIVDDETVLMSAKGTVDGWGGGSTELEGIFSD
jgi:hypothetical protein